MDTVLIREEEEELKKTSMKNAVVRRRRKGQQIFGYNNRMRKWSSISAVPIIGTILLMFFFFQCTSAMQTNTAGTEGKQCVMRGICGKDGELRQNCRYEQLPVPINSSMEIEYSALCPQLFKDGNTDLCCFDSCKTVHLSTLDFSLRVLCGTDIDLCTPEKLFRYIGTYSKTNRIPFTINVVMLKGQTVLHNKTIRPMNFTTYKCDEVPPNFGHYCECSDCHLCTPSAPLPPERLPVASYRRALCTFEKKTGINWFGACVDETTPAPTATPTQTSPPSTATPTPTSPPSTATTTPTSPPSTATPTTTSPTSTKLLFGLEVVVWLLTLALVLSCLGGGTEVAPDDEVERIGSGGKQRSQKKKSSKGGAAIANVAAPVPTQPIDNGDQEQQIGGTEVASNEWVQVGAKKRNRKEPSSKGGAAIANVAAPVPTQPIDNGDQEQQMERSKAVGLLQAAVARCFQPGDAEKVDKITGLLLDKSSANDISNHHRLLRRR